MRKGAVLLLLAGGGCYVGTPRYNAGTPAAPPAARTAPATPAPARPAGPATTPPPSTPPAARMIAEPEAVAAASDYARAHGYAVARVRHVHLDGAGRWHVELQAEGSGDKAK